MSFVFKKWILNCTLAGLVLVCAGGAQSPTPALEATAPELQPRDEQGEAEEEDAVPGAVVPSTAADLLAQAYSQRERGDYAATLSTVRDGLALADQRGDLTMRASFLYVAGRTYWALADYAKSIEMHFEELKLGETLDSFRIQASAHHGLSVAYGSLGEGDASLQHIRQSLDLAAKAGDKGLLAFAHNSMGNAAITFLKDYKVARASHLAALHLREEIGDQRGIADSLTNLGMVAAESGDPTTALEYLTKALKVYVALGLPRHEANSHWRIARVLRGLGQLTEAQKEAQAALALARPLRSQEVLANVYRELALIHEAQGNYQEALVYLRQQTSADSEVRGERARQRTAELQARYETERREHEIARLLTQQALQAAEIRRRRFQSLAVGGGLMVGLVILGAVIFTQRTRIASERRLRTATDGARERAEAAERLKSRLLLIASHDLKTPLASMSALAERIASAPLETENVREFSAGIKADAVRMSTLVRDFLDAAAIEDGRLHLHRTRVDMNEMVRDALKSLRPLAARKNQKLEMPESVAPLVTAVDVERIRQILDNLVGNALKFTPPGGVVEITTGTAGADWVFVQVSDSGPGLRPEDMIKIFKPFQSLSAKPTGDENSSGLGLFITRELLALHGGRLEVESQPGKGGVFRFLLPVVGK